MITTLLFPLAAIGLIMGILSGLLGVGGGVFLVPVLVALGYSPVEAVSTSGVPILLSAVSAITVQLRLKTFRVGPALRIGVPALLVAQAGVWLAHLIVPKLLLALFGSFLLVNILLVRLKPKLPPGHPPRNTPRIRSFKEVTIGSIGGFLGGFFGLGGGVVMVPLQVALLGESIKVAAGISISVVLITAISSVTGHALKGTVLWDVGVALSVGSILGAQIGTLMAPRLSEMTLRRIFLTLLGVLAILVFAKALLS
jgi:uncharacterized membrane protein YfcA